jgi:hypothetical protein
MPALVSIVELQAFIRDTEGVLADSEKAELKGYLAANPEAGVVVPGTGGVRKLRWAASGRGKRGGGRVIYYFHDEEMPLFLFNFFTKAAKSDLTGQEKKALTKVVEGIVAEHKRRK